MFITHTHTLRSPGQRAQKPFKDKNVCFPSLAPPILMKASERYSDGRNQLRARWVGGVSARAMAVTSHSSGILQEYNLKGGRSSWFFGGRACLVMFCLVFKNQVVLMYVSLFVYVYLRGEVEKNGIRITLKTWSK